MRGTTDRTDAAGPETIDLKSVREAFKAWHNSRKLGKVALAHLPIVEHERRQAELAATELGRAEALRTLLRRTIDRFVEEAEMGNTDNAQYRYYFSLTEQYIKRRGVDAVAGELNLGRRRYQEVQNFALEAVAAQLTQWAVDQRRIEESRLPPDTSSPPDVSRFEGRCRELAHYRELLETTHRAVIVGEPGVGKTDLAAKLVRDARDAEQVCWHSCKTNHDVQQILWRIASFLSHHGSDELWRRLDAGSERRSLNEFPIIMQLDLAQRDLSNRGYTVCLDDFQHVEEDENVQQLAARLYQMAEQGQLDLIITSQRQPPFALTLIEPLDGLSSADAARLATARGVGLSPGQFAKLYSKTEGNALFLTLALSALQGGLHPDQFLERLAEDRRIENHLLKSVDEELEERERRVMMALAVLGAEGGNRESIEAVLDGGSARGPLRSLVNRYILKESIRDREGQHYHQHAMVREFYYQEPSIQERRAMHRRAGNYYAAYQQNPVWAAHHYVAAQEHAQAVAQISQDVWIGINQGQLGLLRQILDGFQVKQLAPVQWAEINIAKGVVCTYGQENEAARGCFNTALTALSLLEDAPHVQRLRAKAFREMAVLDRYAPRQSLEWVQKGLKEVEGTDSLEEADLYIQEAIALRSSSELTAAQKRLEQSLALLPPSASYLRMIALLTLGNVAFQKGDAQEAERCYQQALALAEYLNHQATRLRILSNLAAVDHQIAGRWEDALERYQQAIELAQELGSQREVMRISLNRAVLLLHRSHLGKARNELQQVLEHAQTFEMPILAVPAMAYLAEIHLLQKELEAASELLQAAENLAQQAQVLYQLPLIHVLQAEVALQRENVSTAKSKALSAHGFAAEKGLRHEEGMALRVLGMVQQLAGNMNAATATLQEALSLLHDNPLEKKRIEEILNQTPNPSKTSTPALVS